MLTIRLKSEGKKHQKTMRIVVVDSKKSSISNKYIEKIGWWIPAEHKHAINGEKALAWIAKGAQPSATVHNLLVTDKIIEGAKIPKHNHSDKAIEAKNKKDNPEPIKEAVKEDVKETIVEEKKIETKEVVEEPKEEIKNDEIAQPEVSETPSQEIENTETTN